MHLSLCLYAPWNAGVGRTKRSKEPLQTLSRRPEVRKGEGWLHETNHTVGGMSSTTLWLLICTLGCGCVLLEYTCLQQGILNPGKNLIHICIFLAIYGLIKQAIIMHEAISLPGSLANLDFMILFSA